MVYSVLWVLRAGWRDCNSVKSGFVDIHILGARMDIILFFRSVLLVFTSQLTVVHMDGVLVCDFDKEEINKWSSVKVAEYVLCPEVNEKGLTGLISLWANLLFVHVRISC